jgi:hypothetical protein
LIALRELPSGAMCHVGRKTKYVVMAKFWAPGSILSLSHALTVYFKDGDFYEPSIEDVVTTDLVVFCIVLVILAAVFSGLTATRLRRNFGSIPGEVALQERLRYKRIVSTTTLFALVALFVVNHTLFYLFRFLAVNYYNSMSLYQFSMFNFVTYYLRYAN